MGGDPVAGEASEEAYVEDAVRRMKYIGVQTDVTIRRSPAGVDPARITNDGRVLPKGLKIVDRFPPRPPADSHPPYKQQRVPFDLPQHDASLPSQYPYP